MRTLRHSIVLSLHHLSVCVCRCGGKGRHGSSRSCRRPVWPRCLLDCRTESAAFLRAARLPPAHAICRHYRWDTDARMCKPTHAKKKITHEFTFSNLGTFKIQKTRLQREGYTPQDSGEEIYFLNSRAGRYEAVTDELYSAIMEGRACLWDRRRLRGNRLLKRVVFVFQRGKEDKVNKDFLTTTPLWILTWTFFILLFFIIIKFLKTFFIIKRNAFSLHCTVPYIFSVLFHSQ